MASSRLSHTSSANPAGHPSGSSAMLETSEWLQLDNNTNNNNNEIPLHDDNGKLRKEKQHHDRHHQDKQKHQQQQKKKQKKRNFDETLDGNDSVYVASSLANNKKKSKSAGSSARPITLDKDDEEADGETDKKPTKTGKKRGPYKKHKKLAAAAAAAAAAASSASSPGMGPGSATNSGAAIPNNRLILRLPSSRPSSQPPTSPNKKYKKQQKQLNGSLSRRHGTGSPFPHTVPTSPLSSVDSDAAQAMRDGNISDVDISIPLHNSPFYAPFAGDSSSDEHADNMSDLLDDDSDGDDEGDENRMKRSEEKFLIADQIRKLNNRTRKSRTNSRSPRQSEELPSTFDGLAQESLNNQALLPVNGGATVESLFRDVIGSVQDNGEPASSKMEGQGHDDPVTWSGAEDSGLDDLDNLLGLTANDSAAVGGEFSLDEENKTIRFEDFLAEDDGDSSASTSEEDSEESSEDEEADEADRESVIDLTTDADDEHIATTRDVVQNGGFIFFKPGVDDLSDEGMTSEDCPSEGEDDGGDTTDTLDDSDHLGLIRFGIEAADEDDEDAEELLTTALRERHLSDARNMGISISINALAEQPEAVIEKTARTLGVTKETAAKILTSVGMSLLMNGGGAGSVHETPPDIMEAEQSMHIEQHGETNTRKGKGKQLHRLEASAAPSHAPEEGSGLSFLASDARFATEPQPEIQIAPSPTILPAPVSNVNEPIMGDFMPSGGADLCVVVSNNVPAPSPFSARKRRRPRRMTDGSPSVSSHYRGQSVSSVSNQSIASAPPYHSHSNSHSSEEPSYNIIIDIDEFVDMSDVSEEDEDMDDTASISTALTTNQNGVGDFSRWNRIPIGAFRSQNPDETYSSIASAIFSGTRDPTIANNLSFHGGVAVANKGKRSRHIPVSPVLFPANHIVKAISDAKSRKQARKERKIKKIKKEPRAQSLQGTSATDAPSGSASITSSRSKKSSLSTTTTLDSLNHASLPSDGLSHYVSPLFKGMATGLSIPPLTLS